MKTTKQLVLEFFGNFLWLSVILISATFLCQNAWR